MAGVSLTTTSPSVSVGTFPAGLSFRYSGFFWSPLAMSTVWTSNGTPSSSSSQ